MISSVPIPEFKLQNNELALGKRLAEMPLQEPINWAPRFKPENDAVLKP
jgi:hypothetical protein